MKRLNLYLVIILIFSLIIRLWGTNYGLPMTFHMDENVNFGMGLGMIKNHSFNPALTQWGFVRSSFIFNLFAVLAYIHFFLAKIFHWTSTIANPDLPSIFLSGRALIAFLSTLVVYLCFIISKKLYNSKIALFSTLFLSTTFIHVLVSHYGTSDVPQGLFQLIAFYFLYQIVKTGKLKHYVLSGLFIGFAVSANYPAAIMTVNLLIAHFLHVVSFPIDIKKLKNNLLFLLCGLVSIGIGFLIFTPYSLVEYKRFISDISFMRNMYRSGQNAIFASSLNGISTPVWWLLYLATSGFGTTYLFLFFIGIISLVIKPNKTNLLLLSVPLVWFLFMSTNVVRFDRHITPILPITAMIMSFGFCQIIKPFQRKVIFVILFSLLIFVPATVKIIAFDYVIAQKDTRQLTLEWAIKNLDKENPILITGSGIPVGQELNKLGFKHIMEIYSNEPEKIFAYPGEIIITSDEAYRIDKAYQNFPPFTQGWQNMNLIYQKGELIKEISQPLFKDEFFAPFFLEASSTITTYHDPTFRFFKIPYEQ